jgi:hypothetical protein
MQFQADPKMKSIIYICIIIGMWFFMPVNGLKPSTAMANRVPAVESNIVSALPITAGGEAAENLAIDTAGILALLICYCFIAVTLRARNPTLRAN